MYTVVNCIQHRFAVFSAVFLTLITSKARGHGSCRSEELMRCAKPLSVITDTGLTFVSTKSDLEKICPDLRHAVRCIHEYTRRCMNNEARKHFKKLFHGTALMVHDMCTNETYQEEYLKHAACMKKAEPENDLCYKRYQRKMNEIQSQAPVELPPEENSVTYQKKKREAADEGIKNVCCIFQEYVECSTQTMRRNCGEEAAEFSRKFLDKMSSPMINLHCQNYGRRECGLISSADSQRLATSLVAILSVIILYLR